MRNTDLEERTNRANRKVGEFVDALNYGRGAQGLASGVVTGFTVKMPREGAPETLVVVKAENEDGKFVAFTGALTLQQAILIWAAKDRGNGLKWREDVPWSERG